jgi:hypothetical protein
MSDVQCAVCDIFHSLGACDVHVNMMQVSNRCVMWLETYEFSNIVSAVGV